MNWRNIFKPRKFKQHLIDEKYRIIEAFETDGVMYSMFDSAFQVPVGRMLAALMFYEEMEMRCDRAYIENHVKAMEKILSDRKAINLMEVMKLNMYLKERLELMPLPDHIYKLASVIYFDENESKFEYDFEYNKKKIEKWKASGKATLDFFLSRLGEELIPSLKSVTKDSLMYFSLTEKIDETHRLNLSRVLSGN